MIRCLLCRRVLRIPMFPFNLYFWRRRGVLYITDIDIKGEEYSIKTVLCDKDYLYTIKNKTVADGLIQARISRMENDLDS